MADKPFSAACERNKHAILEYLNRWLSDEEQVLEVGSGTGQHAAYFISQCADVTWQCTNHDSNLFGLQQWLDDANNKGLLKPFSLDVSHYDWSAKQYTTVYTANTLHMMSWPDVENFLRGVAQALSTNGKLIIYGPFRYQDEYTSASNAEFDRFLRERDPDSGIRDVEKVQQLLQEQGFELLDDVSMPANNQLLCFRL